MASGRWEKVRAGVKSARRNGQAHQGAPGNPGDAFLEFHVGGDLCG
jgi:hypothetical protein